MDNRDTDKNIDPRGVTSRKIYVVKKSSDVPKHLFEKYTTITEKRSRPKSYTKKRLKTANDPQDRSVLAKIDTKDKTDGCEQDSLDTHFDTVGACESKNLISVIVKKTTHDINFNSFFHTIRIRYAVVDFCFIYKVWMTYLWMNAMKSVIHVQKVWESQPTTTRYKKSFYTA